MNLQKTFRPVLLIAITGSLYFAYVRYQELTASVKILNEYNKVRRLDPGLPFAEAIFWSSLQGLILLLPLCALGLALVYIASWPPLVSAAQSIWNETTTPNGSGKSPSRPMSAVTQSAAKPSEAVGYSGVTMMCPECSATLVIPHRYAGTIGTCKHCGSRISVLNG